MKTYNLNKVQFDFKGAYIETTKEIHLYMQRQGVSETINCAHPLFFIEISTYAADKGKWCGHVSYSNDYKIYGFKKAGQYYKSKHDFTSKEKALEFLLKQASKLSKKLVTVDDQIINYCYGWYPYEYQKEDKHLSSVYYDPKTYAVKNISNNKIIVAFENGDILKPVKQSKKYKDVVEKVLETGFHNCDYDKGNDYCVRRAAWLISETFNQEYINNYMEFVNLQMEKEG